MARRLVLAALAAAVLTGCTATPQNTGLSPDTVTELVADFYDVGGRLLGTASTSYGEDANPDPAAQSSPAEKDGVVLTVNADPAWRAQVNSVVLGVPVLVSE